MARRAMTEASLFLRESAGIRKVPVEEIGARIIFESSTAAARGISARSFNASVGMKKGFEPCTGARTVEAPNEGVADGDAVGAPEAMEEKATATMARVLMRESIL